MKKAKNMGVREKFIKVANERMLLRHLCDIIRFTLMAENTKSRKDAFRERYAKRNPGLNMEDEEAYYGSAENALNDLESYEESSRRMRSSLEKSPAFAEMITAAREQEDFDPVVWAVETGRLDLDALQSDKEYAAKLGDAHKAALERRASQEAIDKQFDENFPKSMEAINAKAAELGVDYETKTGIIGKMYELMDDMIVGKLSVDVFELLAKGNNYDEAVATARDEGVAEGLNTRVNDKLRTLKNQTSRSSGRQAPMRERKPEPEIDNPFLA